MFELLGLAWHTIAASGVTLFWQTLASSGAWTDPAMSFQLTRCVLYMCTSWLVGLASKASSMSRISRRMSQEERLRWVHFKDPPIQVSHTHAYSLGSMGVSQGKSGDRLRLLILYVISKGLRGCQRITTALLRSNNRRGIKLDGIPVVMYECKWVSREVPVVNILRGTRRKYVCTSAILMLLVGR